jgi:hypothetical protein
MKVTKITEQSYKDARTGVPRSSWWTSFENEERQLYSKTKPDLAEGAEVDITSLEVKLNKAGKPFFIIPDKSKGETPVQRYTDDSEIWTTKRCCLMQAVQLWGYANPGKPVDCGIVWDYYTRLLAALMLPVTREKK